MPTPVGLADANGPRRAPLLERRTLDREFGGEGLWIDSARLSLTDTVTTVLENLESARLTHS